MLKFVDWNERRHRVDAMQYLKKQSLFTKEKISHDVHQHRLTDEIALTSVNNILKKINTTKKSKATCMATNEKYIFIGTTKGEIHMWHKANQAYFSCFFEKDIKNTAITFITVHPVLSRYVLIGYQFGQMCLIDV